MCSLGDVTSQAKNASTNLGTAFSKATFNISRVDETTYIYLNKINSSKVTVVVITNSSVLHTLRDFVAQALQSRKTI